VRRNKSRFRQPGRLAPAKICGKKFQKHIVKVIFSVAASIALHLLDSLPALIYAALQQDNSPAL
jgi:hypothetical protein